MTVAGNPTAASSKSGKAREKRYTIVQNRN
jgi:hypothetical protein